MSNSAAGAYYARLDYVCVDEASLNALVGARVDYLPGYSDHPGIAVGQFHMHPFWNGALGHNMPARQHRTKHLRKSDWPKLAILQDKMMDFPPTAQQEHPALETPADIDIAVADFLKFCATSNIKCFPPPRQRTSFRPPIVCRQIKMIKRLCSVIHAARDPTRQDKLAVTTKLEDTLLASLADNEFNSILTALKMPGMDQQPQAYIRARVADWAIGKRQVLREATTIKARK